MRECEARLRFAALPTCRPRLQFDVRGRVYDPYSSRGEHDRTILTQFGSALATFQLPDVDVPRLQGRTQGSVRSRCAKPEQWPGSEDNVPNSEVSASRHFLSEDFCVLDGEHYFVRCILEIPIIGSAGQRFALTGYPDMGMTSGALS